MSRRSRDIDTATAELVVGEERNLEQIAQEQQADKEQRIAETYEIAGRIQAMTFIGKVATVANLIQLKRIKDSKAYRDLPHVGTWEEFCNYVNLDRRTVDEDLQNLNTFGEDFLATCQQFQLGYRDLRKLRQLTHSGAITIDADAVVIGEDRIPLTSDHREDLQCAIEQIIEEQARLSEELEAQKKTHKRVQDASHKEIVKLQKENDRYAKKAEARGLTIEEDGFITRVAGFRDLAQGAFIALDPTAVDNIIPEDLTIRMRTAIIAAVHALKMQALALYDTVVTQIGDSTINPEVLEEFAQWEKETGYSQPK